MAIRGYKSVAEVLADMPEFSIDWQFALAAAWAEYPCEATRCAVNVIRWFSENHLPELDREAWIEFAQGCAGFAQAVESALSQNERRLSEMERDGE